MMVFKFLGQNITAKCLLKGRVALPAVAVFLGYCPLALPAQDAPLPQSNVSITVKVLNGKTGLPVWRESANIWIDDDPQMNPKTNLLGTVKIKIPGKAVQLTITPNWAHECRWDGKPNTKFGDSYSVAEILSTGVVSDNFCGATKVAPTPGVLVFYERPTTWKERWNTEWLTPYRTVTKALS